MILTQMALHTIDTGCSSMFTCTSNSTGFVLSNLVDFSLAVWVIHKIVLHPPNCHMTQLNLAVCANDAL